MGYTCSGRARYRKRLVTADRKIAMKSNTTVANRVLLLRLLRVLSLSGYPATTISSLLSYIRVGLRVGASSREDK